MLIARSAVGRACRPFRSRHINNNKNNNASVQASWSRSASEIAVIDRKGKGRQIDDEDAHQLQEQPSKEPLRLDLNAPSTSKLPSSTSTSTSASSSCSSPPPAVLQRTIAIQALSKACRQSTSSKAWRIFMRLTPAQRRGLPSSVLHELLQHQLRYSQHRDRRKDIEQELEDESARECWRRAGITLLYMKNITPEIKATIRTIARKALEEVQTSADLAMERYTRPGQGLVQTVTGPYRAIALLLAYRRFCGAQAIEIYQKLLIFGISVNQELYDFITHLGDYIPRYESIPFPTLRRAAQCILPLRSVEDGHKRQRHWPPKATNDLSEEEALLRKTILTGANAKQLFKLSLETRDYLLAQYLYTYLRPPPLLLHPTPSSAASASASSSESTPLVRRRAKGGENRFLWTSDDTTYFISLFRSLAHDALHFRHSRSSKERLASLSSCSVLYEHWMKDSNSTPGVLKMEIAEIALAQIVHEYAEKMWSLLLKDQSFMFEKSQLEEVVRKCKSWNNEDARQKAHIVAKRLLSPRSRYSPLISQTLYTLLLETFAKADLPEASSVEDEASLLKEALRPFDEVWAHMVKHGQPDLQAYNTNLQLRARTKEYDASITLWKDMLKSDISPDRMAYNYVLKAYLDKGDPEGAQALIEQASLEGIVLKEQEEMTCVAQAKEAGRPEQSESTSLVTAALHEHGTESCRGHSSGMGLGFCIAAAPTEEIGKPRTQQHVAENEMDNPFLAAFFTSNDCSPPEDAPVANTAVTVPEPGSSSDPTEEEESTFLAPALAFNRSPTISFPSFSLSQASPPSKLSEASIFASSGRSPSSGSRDYHPANTWEAMLDLAQAARERLDNYACREQALQLADNRLRLERADMGRWSGWKEHQATPWY